MKRVCLVTTSVLIVRFFLIPYLRRLSEVYEVTLAVDTDDQEFLRGYGLNVRVVPIAIERRISPWRDVVAFGRLARLFSREHFDVVHSFSPKGGLLAMLAARMCHVGVRLHTFTGQVWANRSGLMRAVLKAADRITAWCATQVFADSASQQKFIEQEGVTPAGRGCRVLAGGSISGVDLARFQPDRGTRARVRDELGVPRDALLFLFVGRLARDKGVLDLAQAFAELASERRDCYLLFVGPDEDRLAAPIEAVAAEGKDRLRFRGYTPAPEQFVAAADVLCLPSYREGFGVVIIEAAACGIPAVASRIYGITDAVVEEETGILHDPGNEAEIAAALRRFAENPGLRQQMGRAARARVEREFSEDRVIGAVLDYYACALHAKSGLT